MADATNYAENLVVDLLFRNGSGNLYLGLLTAITDAEAGSVTEVAGGNYARVAVPKTVSAWAGTQGAGTTVASTGSSGETSNNGDVTFPAPSANWGTITGVGVYDSATGGNLLYVHQLLNSSGVAITRSILAGDDAPYFGAGQLKITVS